MALLTVGTGQQDTGHPYRVVSRPVPLLPAMSVWDMSPGCPVASRCPPRGHLASGSFVPETGHCSPSPQPQIRPQGLSHLQANRAETTRRLRFHRTS